MQDNDVKKFLDASVSRERPRDLLIEMVRVPSPQTALLEEEPLLKEFIRKAIEPRLRAMGFADVYYNAMGNLIASYGAGTNGNYQHVLHLAWRALGVALRHRRLDDVFVGDSLTLRVIDENAQSSSRSWRWHRCTTFSALRSRTSLVRLHSRLVLLTPARIMLLWRRACTAREQ